MFINNSIFFLDYIRILRPQQWLKNLLLYFPSFLSGSIISIEYPFQGVMPIIAFCMGSSATYILNDIIDSDNDKHHPRKKYRPIPSGTISKITAAVLALLLLCAGLTFATFSVSIRFSLYLVLYLLVSTLYSLKLKAVPLVDIFCIATGFIIRLEAGGEAFAVPISDWLFLTVFLLALFLSIGKRLNEKLNLGNEAKCHRKSLAGYPDGFLDGAMYLTGGAVLVTYSMYTLSRSHLFYTVPLCCFGLLRYIFRVKSGQSGDPTESLLKDVPLLLVSLTWAAIIGWRLYF
ncbi:decaprenyl-phosphate phosphoribosyltransferase [Geobacter pickeringii]|uniref:Phosphoribose diphosphate:decaprenyl-phosphate phosphoribosyltransferase n=1 Tax=Geobacter pickeringii TaxID=345632 RepID=A0A0B5BH91_9BACT|nr:decaprenyl-phosphate phosphoribosyltransferase [Geobacter pickeringii]AJE03396.1 phosphoribose diphosphate:decaprenyl-phosphate phosphoribosyltransferase [Geobacter pickeringii]